MWEVLKEPRQPGHFCNSALMCTILRLALASVHSCNGCSVSDCSYLLSLVLSTSWGKQQKHKLTAQCWAKQGLWAACPGEHPRVNWGQPLNAVCLSVWWLRPQRTEIYWLVEKLLPLWAQTQPGWDHTTCYRTAFLTAGVKTKLEEGLGGFVSFSVLRLIPTLTQLLQLVLPNPHESSWKCCNLGIPLQAAGAAAFWDPQHKRLFAPSPAVSVFSDIPIVSSQLGYLKTPLLGCEVADAFSEVLDVGQV